MTRTIPDTASGALLRLKAAVQQYDWGNTGPASLVARLAPHAVGPDFHLDEHASYAEVNSPLPRAPTADC
ncbi:hypothetical protein AcV5_009951 [Taiwanofungus camphoratus]|nr:hypothetical protein AcV5_009951 [Antrodia cinnamomea]